MSAQFHSDLELIKQFVNGKQSSIETLISRHKNKIFTYIVLKVKNHHLAEDIFQDTFIKVIDSLLNRKYKDEGKFLSWVMRIAHNLIMDHFRKEKQLKTTSNDDYEFNIFNSKEFSDFNVEDIMIKDQISENIKDLIEKLPKEQKEIVILRHYAGLGFKEIAEEKSISINTALGRMRYALMNLRKMIEERNLCLSKY